MELVGLVNDKIPWTVQQLDTLPQTEMVICHICVRGWDYIGQWSGPTLRSFLERVRADLRAKYVVFQTTDDYPNRIDTATQTRLAMRYAGEVLRLDEHEARVQQPEMDHLHRGRRYVHTREKAWLELVRRHLSGRMRRCSQ